MHFLFLTYRKIFSSKAAIDSHSPNLLVLSADVKYRMCFPAWAENFLHAQSKMELAFLSLLSSSLNVKTVRHTKLSVKTVSSVKLSILSLVVSLLDL